MSYQSIGVNADCNILLCVANDKVGTSSDKSFTFNPATGVVCACCFKGSCLDFADISINPSSNCNNVVSYKYGVEGCTYYSSLYIRPRTTCPFLSRIMTQSRCSCDNSGDCDACIMCAIRQVNYLSSSRPLLYAMGTIAPSATSDARCSVTCITYDENSSCWWYTIHYNGGCVKLYANCQTVNGALNIIILPQSAIW